MIFTLTRVLLNLDIRCFWQQCRFTSVGFFRSQLEKANLSGSAMLFIKNMDLFQQPGSSNMIGRKLEVGVASEFIQHGKG